MGDGKKKVYDYAPEKVRDRLVDAFRRSKGEATCSDLVALTGLPKYQVDAEVKAVSDEYGARLRVTESGEILYSFPRGMRSRYRGLGPQAKRAWKVFKKGAAAVGMLLFKGWIVFMLVGYFVLFAALALLALLASVAVSASGSRDSRSDRRGGGLGGLWLTGRILEAFVNRWFYSELFKSPEERAARYRKNRERKPLYKAIFSFVFGDGDPDALWDEVEKRAVIAFLRANRGLITLPEFMAISGLPPLEAEERINRYMVEFEGSPEATEGGAVVFLFPGLLRASKESGVERPSPSRLSRSIAPFSANPRKSNRLFVLINAANLLFGSYFLYGAATAHSLLPILYGPKYVARLVMTQGLDAFYLFVHQLLGKLAGLGDPGALLGIGLGVVPLAFSVFFYAIPALRSLRLASRNERARFENLRREAYAAALKAVSSGAEPRPIGPRALDSVDEASRPRDERAPERIFVELAAWTGAEPRADGSYDFAELARVQAEARKARAAIDPSSFELGDTIFDSHS
ncbi:MAG: hypothetical protein Q8M76_18770 [Spirochaetaceae bacterium]|nr:hypothetical protein [Spirochaetaceae bacterium]